ncbi:MAG: Carbohydrate-selective porin OprB [Bryobacterales bacterium]|nr:Carbohydrate-selective porin OprB [Bryobacterales bacterium]
MKVTPTVLRRAAGDLLHPLLVGVSGDPGYSDAPAFQVEEEQHIIGNQPAPAKDRHREEVAPSQYVHMSCEEVLPGRDLASLGSRGNAVPTEYVFYRLIRQPMAQIRERTDDSVIAPARVLSRHPNDQGFYFRRNRRAAGILSIFGPIELLGDQLTIPGQNSVRLGNTSDFSKCFARDASLTSTLFFGLRLERNTVLYFDPEIAGGRGFSGVDGLANSSNGELPRVASATPKPYVARFYVSHDFAFGDEMESFESEENQVGGQRPMNRYTVTVGRFTLTDFFDNNRYSHDPRTQFMGWAVMYNGAWDHPADVRGYSWG